MSAPKLLQLRLPLFDLRIDVSAYDSYDSATLYASELTTMGDDLNELVNYCLIHTIDTNGDSGPLMEFSDLDVKQQSEIFQLLQDAYHLHKENSDGNK